MSREAEITAAENMRSRAAGLLREEAIKRDRGSGGRTKAALLHAMADLVAKLPPVEGPPNSGQTPYVTPPAMRAAIRRSMA